MKRHLEHIRQLEEVTGESLVAGLLAVGFVLVAAWAGAIMMWGVGQ